MGKYKICVYAICKNEEKFVDSWVASMKEADEIIVLDTGSSDNTVKKLKNYGVKVFEKIINPWRFDIARNESLKHIPTYIDFCCCVDLDETFKKGWRKELENNLADDVSRVSYRYTWNFNLDGSEGVVFYADKIHRNQLFIWEHPVHETLKQIDFKFNNHIKIPTLELYHHADLSKSRSSYLPLLELSVKEDPTSDRNVHYLGREYYFYGQYENAIKMLEQHLNMPNSIWKEERSSSCRIIASCYEKLKMSSLALKYYKLAIAESPTSREPFIELAKYCYRKSNYITAITYIFSALNIINRELNYMSQPECWNETPYDILALCFYHLKDYKNASYYGKIATDINPKDLRLKNNLNSYQLKLQQDIIFSHNGLAP